MRLRTQLKMSDGCCCCGSDGGGSDSFGDVGPSPLTVGVVVAVVLTRAIVLVVTGSGYVLGGTA